MRPIHLTEIKYCLIIVAVTTALFFTTYDVRHPKAPKPRNYQIEVHMDTIWLYRGDKLVSKYITDYSKGLDSIIYQDNN